VTGTAALAEHLPSRQQVQRTASEFAFSLAVELLVVGVVRRLRRGRRPAGPRHQRHEHPLLRAVMAQAKAEGATELSTQRRRMMFQVERRLDAETAAARHRS
jgi:hypothetical protein